MDYKVFVSYNKLMFILVYTDNLLIIDKNLNIINGFKNKLFKYFYIIDLDISLLLFRHVCYLNSRVCEF